VAGASRVFDHVVIGAGVVGASAAWRLALAGRKVLLVERAEAGADNPVSASGDHSKIFRHAYGDDEKLTRMCAEALGLWREVERACGRELYVRTGFLALGEGSDSWARRSASTLERLGLGFEVLSASEVARRFPVEANGLFDHALLDLEAGFLRAQKAVRAISGLARSAGVEVWEGTEVLSVGEEVATSRGAVRSQGPPIVAAGAWAAKLVPELARRVFVTRQKTAYLRPAEARDFVPGRLPVLLSFREGFYLLPIHHDGAVKIATHLKTDRVDPDAFGREVEPAFVEECRAFLKAYVPALAGAEEALTRTCLYTNTETEDFILDRAGPAIVASACSGHGFKMGPLTGRIAAELAMGVEPSGWDPRFRR